MTSRCPRRRTARVRHAYVADPLDFVTEHRRPVPLACLAWLIYWTVVMEISPTWGDTSSDWLGQAAKYTPARAA